MVGFSKGVAILIGLIVGIVILPFLGISEIFSIIIIGFIANYLTVQSQRSYKIGAITGGILGFLIFMYGFFFYPQLSDLPNISDYQLVSFGLGGLFNLLMEFVVLIVVSTALGALGGKIAQMISPKKKPESSGRYKRRTESPKKFKSKKPRRSLNRR